VVAQCIAGCPVVHIPGNPFFKDSEILGFKAGMDGIRPLAGDKGLFQITGLPQRFAQREDLLLI